MVKKLEALKQYVTGLHFYYNIYCWVSDDFAHWIEVTITCASIFFSVAFGENVLFKKTAKNLNKGER